MVPCCGISFLLTAFLVKSHSLKRDDDAKLQEAGKEWVARHKGLSGLSKNKELTVKGDDEKRLNGTAMVLSSSSEKEGI
jgi:hypothetical protein